MSKKFPLRVFHNDILFQFNDELTVLRDGKINARGFKEKTDWGFVFVSANESAANARWATIVAVGPKTKPDMYVGRTILIENLKWTAGVDFQGEKYWKTTDEFVMCLNIAEDK